jgi:predicted transcriptional regulator
MQGWDVLLFGFGEWRAGSKITIVELGSCLGRSFSASLSGMEIHFSPEQEAQLARIASEEGMDAERLVKDAALRLLEEDAHFRAAVRKGIAQADRGEFIEEEMAARLEQMLRS